MNGLGALFERLKAQYKAWRNFFFVVLAGLVGLNFVINTHEPHFGLDKYPGFFAGFGLIIGLVMVLVMKKIVQPLIARKEDHYGDI
ncbi:MULTISPECIES: hypothetical protein [Desulfovibrio]|uniref:hypothetical protein n=1 Tax=Desulfovibrio TaxID=872 RepID=UPI002CD9D329|nr:hypothetical protein [Desulfovibrio sp.]HMM38096.1 hypothetical protein [Desulfovibrio sp.]